MIEPINPLPILKMVGVFMGVTVLIVAGIAGLEYLWPDLNLSKSTGTATTFGAAMAAGIFGANRTKRLPTRREKLIFAVWATLLPMLAIVALYWSLFAYNGVPFTTMTFLTALTGKLPNAGVMNALAWILLLAVTLSLLVTYFCVGFGAKTQLKSLARQEAKTK